MPTTHTILSYKFEELSPKAKERARDWFRESALDYDWWDSTYEDAASIGLKITGFDLGRGGRVDGSFTQTAKEVAVNIMANHGDECRTYIEAIAFLLEDVEAIGVDAEEAAEARAQQFERNIRGAYWDILNTESEYLTSDECVDESITANDYDFDADGRRFRY